MAKSPNGGSNADGSDPSREKPDASDPASVEASAGVQSKSGDTVVVGCKLPHGLVIELSKKVEDSTFPGGFKWIGTGDRITLNGSGNSTLIGGFGVTRDVDRGFIEEWMKQNGTTDIMKNELVFICSEKEVKDMAKDRADVKTGLEPMDPAKPGAKLEPVPSAGS